jgi:hypothetical protein
MRKFILNDYVDPTSFMYKVKLVEKTEDEVITIFDEVWVSSPSKYTPEQLKKINFCNEILAKENKESLSEEEIEFMLDPTGMNKRLRNIEKQMIDTETLQRMAGFKVEKKIVPLD